MNGSFLSFDSVRARVRDTLAGFTLPENAPDVYLVRNLLGTVRLAATEEAESDDPLRLALEDLGRKLSNALGPYGSGDQALVLWLAESLINGLRDARRKFLPGVYWVDRLVVGGGWWTVGDHRPDRIPARYTLYSAKGGVGRSTTAVVLARHLAAKSINVLVLDLDLESPGLASAVLPPENQPTYGVTDWFVEDLVDQGDRVLDDMTGSPPWARDLPGSVWIVPAHGREPGEFLAKLGRVYVDAAVELWPRRLNRLVTGLEEALRPTVVLIESRSGLHDIAAATVTDLDAEVLLFGVDSPSTWMDYEILFDHWRRQGLAARMRDRLSIVSALTPETGEEPYWERFRERAWDLFRDRLYDALSGANDDDPEAVSHDMDSQDAAHSPLVIRWNRGLAGGTDLRRFEESAVQQAYSSFLRSFDQRFGYVQLSAPIVVVSTTADAARRLLDIETRRITLAELPEGTSHGDRIRPEHVYLPPSHRKALAPNVSLVTGIRGSGKTFWWTALQDPAVRRLIGDEGSISAIGSQSVVRAGFGVLESPRDYPTQFELVTLLGAGVDPRLIWRAVHARCLVDSDHPLAALDSWQARVRYVQDNTDPVVRLFRDRDNSLDAESAYSMVVFDGLDRAADRWGDAFRMIRGLLRHALDMRSYRRLRAKVFLRTDQFDEGRIADFPDASKILADAVELSWPRRDLYGMLWHYLANSRAGATLREFLTPGDWPHVEFGGRVIYGVPALLGSDEEYQRQRFHQITGPWMGSDRRRGFPYTWIPNHLADTSGSVSPRSFLKALRTAAVNTAERHPGYEYALHYDSIKRGVREASKIRVRELREDYPWVGSLLAPLSGVVVPCRFTDVEGIWVSQRTIEDLKADAQEDTVKLPPRSVGDGPRGVRRDLEALGVFRRLGDGRVDIPDVFRLGYGIGRKGGVRPAR